MSSSGADLALLRAAHRAACRAAEHWGVGGEPRLLKRLENFTYEVGSGSDRRIIRVTDLAHRSVAELEAELDFLLFLSRRGVSVCAPLRAADASLVKTFDSEPGTFHASVFERARGRPVRFPEDWSPALHCKLGELLGSLHAAAREYAPGSAIQKRKSWRQDLHGIGRHIPEREVVARREFEEVVAWASSLPTEADCFGLVHTDLNHSNYFVDEQAGVTAFDFDDCHYSWFAYDLAVPLFYALISFDLPSSKVEEQDWFFGPLLEGYRRHTQICELWLARIPSFVRLRRVDLFAFMCKELDVVDPRDPWDRRALRRIREGFLAGEPLR